MKTQAELYRELPSVDELVRDPGVSELVTRDGQAAVADACRTVLGNIRAEVAAGHLDEDKLKLALSGVQLAIRNEVRRALGYSLRTVINASGVVLHTNLGRAPLAASAIEHIRETGGVYSNLEFELESGERGKRDVHVDRLFRRLLSDEFVELRSTERKRTARSMRTEGNVELRSTGRVGAPAPMWPLQSEAAISTIVVNNNAAAVLLALNTLAEGGEVIVSRGELVEIGGSFRIPEVMAKSGAVLREVGTTNRTRASDYERAINERTRLLLRVHRSNFEISGFTEQPSIAELVAVAQKHKLPLMEDLGSGALFDLCAIGVNDEPGVLDSLRAGVHIVTYSGDKLLGGPQAGLISGREDLVKKMRGNSLFRALRVDKLRYAALEATLLAYVKRDYGAIPALRMMQISKEDIAMRAAAVCRRLADEIVPRSRIQIDLVDGESLLGGGSAPSATLPTKLIAISCAQISAEELATRLRRSERPVLARLEEGRVLLDLRTVFPEQDEVLSEVLARSMTV
jgi:L-seryl-tRNA(Ser) seleniumtransferase